MGKLTGVRPVGLAAQQPTNPRKAITAGTLAACVLLPVVGCGTHDAAADPEQPEHVRAYLEQALAFIEENSLHVATDPEMNWDEIRKSAQAKASGAQRTEDTYPEITEALEKASGNHSFFVSPDEAARARTRDPAFPTVQMAAEDVALLTLPAFNETAGGLVNEYAAAAVTGIAEGSVAATCGWIIDLRDNGGGNMFPMHVAVAPFLPDGEVLSFVDGEGDESKVTVDGMEVFVDGELVLRSTLAAPDLSDRPVAVLQSGNTASSAEATLLSLRSGGNVRTFGSPSGGYATGNVTAVLPDGAMLAVTQSRMVSPDGTSYPGPIDPDESTREPEQAALEWLSRSC